MDKYIGLVLIGVGCGGVGYLIGKRQGVWKTLMNSTGLWGRPKGLKLIHGTSTKKKDWKGLKK